MLTKRTLKDSATAYAQGGIAAALGADGVLLNRCCDPLYRKAIRVSVGAALAVPFARGGTEQALVTDQVRAGLVVRIAVLYDVLTAAVVAAPREAGVV